MAARPKKTEPDRDDIEVPDWVLLDDHEKYVAAHIDGELEAAGFGSREEYEGRSEMDKIAAESEEKPAPKPGDPDYEWAVHYPKGLELYWHTFPNGKSVAIVDFGEIYDEAWLYTIRDLETPLQVETAALNRASCPTADAVIEDAMSNRPLGAKDNPWRDLHDAWRAAATARAEGQNGIDSGE